MHLVDNSREAAALRRAILAGSNDLHSLSLEAGGLAGMLQLISGSDKLTEPHRLALAMLADAAQRLENEIEAIAVRLDDAEPAA